MPFNRLDFGRNYVVDQVLSEKPRSTVLLTRKRGGAKQTVMKLSDPAATNPLEKKCLSSLRHPGIAKCLGSGLTRDRRSWLETDYIDGVPLSAWLSDQSERQPKTTDQTVNSTVFLRLLSVVQYLHCCGWLHGDLSPQNILISSDQRNVVLIDFEHTSEIDSPAIMTTPRRHSLEFASPHEINGGRTTEQCEQYSLAKLGMMLLEQTDHLQKTEISAALHRAAADRPEDRYPDLHSFEIDLRANCS